jgi:hypothetical protein
VAGIALEHPILFISRKEPVNESKKDRFFLCTGLMFFSLLAGASALDKNVTGHLTNWTWTNKCIADWFVPAFN